MYHALGQAPRVAAVLNNLGLVAHRAGDNTRAQALHAESLALKRALGNAAGVATSLHNLGLVALEQGDMGRAAPLFAESLTLKRGLGNMQGLAASLDGLAEVAGAGGQAHRAARLLGAAAALRVALAARPKELLSAPRWARRPSRRRGRRGWAGRRTRPSPTRWPSRRPCSVSRPLRRTAGGRRADRGTPRRRRACGLAWANAAHRRHSGYHEGLSHPTRPDRPL